MDCDQQDTDSCGIETEALRDILQRSLDQETELLRTYTMTSERIHQNEELKVRLQNFAEGNAKRSRQLMDEIARLNG
jgi:hypothetical protein